MKKIAIIAEGQSELIFIRTLLYRIMDCSKICFRCFQLYAGRTIPTKFDFPNPNAEISFLIINVGQDEKVLSFIKEREQDLLQNGYEKIIGLRDMYSEEYIKRSPNAIDDNISNAFVNGWKLTIQNMSDPTKITLCVAIMELEAWFLAMYHIFERINTDLNVEFIEKELGFNLTSIDPQSEFIKPSEIVDRIFQLVGSQYNKKEHDVEMICSRINAKDISNIKAKGICDTFIDFYEELSKLINV